MLKRHDCTHDVFFSHGDDDVDKDADDTFFTKGWHQLAAH